MPVYTTRRVVMLIGAYLTPLALRLRIRTTCCSAAWWSRRRRVGRHLVDILDANRAACRFASVFLKPTNHHTSRTLRRYLIFSDALISASVADNDGRVTGAQLVRVRAINSSPAAAAAAAAAFAAEE